MRCHVTIEAQVRGQAYTWSGDVTAERMADVMDGIPDDAMPELDDVTEDDFERMSFSIIKLREQRKRPAKKVRG